VQLKEVVGHGAGEHSLSVHDHHRDRHPVFCEQGTVWKRQSEAGQHLRQLVIEVGRGGASLIVRQGMADQGADFLARNACTEAKGDVPGNALINTPDNPEYFR
jgi:hypothetical protein